MAVGVRVAPRLGFVQEAEQFAEGLGTTIGTTFGNVVGGFIGASAAPVEWPIVVGLGFLAIIVVGPPLLKTGLFDRK